MVFQGALWVELVPERKRAQQNLSRDNLKELLCVDVLVENVDFSAPPSLFDTPNSIFQD